MATTIDCNVLSLEQLRSLRMEVDAKILAMNPEKGPKEKKEKKEKRASQGTAWASFGKVVSENNSLEYSAFKEAAENKQGVMPRFASAYRATHMDEWKEFQAKWSLEHPKGALAPPKEPKAPKEAKAPKEKAPKQPKEVAEPKEATEVAEVKEAKKRGPKKLVDMTPEELAAHKQKVADRKKSPAAKAEEKAAMADAPITLTLSSPCVGGGGTVPVPALATVTEESATSDEVEFKSFTIDGAEYQRLSTGSEWASGDLWYTKKDGSRGDYLGELMEDGSINGDAKEPELN